MYIQQNKVLLLYHLVFSLKITQELLNNNMSVQLNEICLQVSKLYEVTFLEIVCEFDHVHFLVQGVPSMSVGKLEKVLKIITVRALYILEPSIFIKLNEGVFWNSGYYANTSGQYGNIELIQKYIAIRLTL